MKEMDAQRSKKVAFKVICSIVLIFWIGWLTVWTADSALAQTDEAHYYVRALPEPLGFAFAGDGTTGGEGGQEVTVTNAEQLLHYATSDEPYIVNVVDTIEIVRRIGDYIETNGEYHLGSNTTLRGVGTSATIKYGGFRVSDAENVIIQNLTFDGTYEGYHSSLEGIECSEVPEGRHRYKNGACLEPGDKGPTDDAIEVTEGSERVWITQNTFKRYSDEAMSVKREASYVTISWNRFDDLITGKNGMMILIGSGDNHYFDEGRLRTTLHHNYLAARTRHPRTRYGIVHIFNNYYHGVNDGIMSTMGAEILVENNYFEDVNNTWHIGYGSSDDGFLVQQNNIFDNTDPGPTNGELGDEVTPPSDFYDYTMDAPEDVPALVMEGVGAGESGDYSEQIMAVPALPVLESPVGETGTSRHPSFEWSEAILAMEYRLQIKEGIGEEEPVVLDTLVSRTEFAYSSDMPGLSSDKTYFWRVRASNSDATGQWTAFEYFVTGQPTSANEGKETKPQQFELTGNYPNPFNPVTTISYKMPVRAHVDLRVYDITGREAAVLVNREQAGAHYFVDFRSDAYGLSSGVYLYRFRAVPLEGSARSTFTRTRKMYLIK